MYYDDVNEVRLTGNLVKNAEVIKPKSQDSQSEFVKVQLATNESWYHDRNLHTHTEYTSVLFNSKSDVKVASGLEKGDRIYVAGRLRVREWQDDKGVKHTIPVIVANHQGLRILKKKSVAKAGSEKPETTGEDK